MATTIRRPVSHDAQMSLVDHLDELRSRLITCALTFAIAFAICVWQDGPLLNIVNQPLENTTTQAQGGGRISETARAQTSVRRAFESNLAFFKLVAESENFSATEKAAAREAIANQQAAIKDLPRSVPKRSPVTLGVGEPFVTTITVSAWFALLFSLPLILYQIYGFVLPAFTPGERKVATPLLLAVPFLFIAGVVFGYVLVLPAAIKFLQNFNSESFDILVQAKDYYRFVVMALLSLGILFQIPVGILALTRLGIVSVAQLRRQRRYAIVVIAVIAMLLPGTDPVTMLISMAPLLVLYEGSVLVAAFFEKRYPVRPLLDFDWDEDEDEDDDPDNEDDGWDDDDPGPDDDPDLGGPNGDGTLRSVDEAMDLGDLDDDEDDIPEPPIEEPLPDDFLAEFEQPRSRTPATDQPDTDKDT